METEISPGRAVVIVAVVGAFVALVWLGHTEAAMALLAGNVLPNVFKGPEKKK